MANGATQAVENATRLSEIGFPEFTAKLITDTFNAITSSYLNQTAQYSGVVQAVSQTLQDYINNTADDISADEIGAFEFSARRLHSGGILEYDRGSRDQQCCRLAARGGAQNGSGVFWQSHKYKKTNDLTSNRASCCKQ